MLDGDGSGREEEGGWTKDMREWERVRERERERERESHVPRMWWMG